MKVCLSLAGANSSAAASVIEFGESAQSRQTEVTMADFPDSIVRQALERAGRRCECTSYSCFHHTDRCKRIFGLQAHHKVRGGPDTLDNCEILCEACHRNAHSFNQRQDMHPDPREVPS